MQVHILSGKQRRMLLEALTSERAGEDALFVGHHLGRDRIASGLCRLRVSDWVDDSHIVLTEYGRHLAESLATRLVDRLAYAELLS